jgi:hypothetical protein
MHYLDISSDIDSPSSCSQLCGPLRLICLSYFCASCHMAGCVSGILIGCYSQWRKDHETIQSVSNLIYRSTLDHLLHHLCLITIDFLVSSCVIVLHTNMSMYVHFDILVRTLHIKKKNPKKMNWVFFKNTLRFRLRAP